MSYEMAVGLDIINDDIYTSYRSAMTPLLEEYGGGFRYDFKISKVLKNEENRPINRVFLIYFKDQASMNTFFNHPDYLEIKSRFFESSVKHTTILSEYEVL